MTDTLTEKRPAGSRPAVAPPLTQALARLADALEQPNADAGGYAAAYASVLNLASPSFLDGQADYIGSLVSRLAADRSNERLFDAWVHFMDHFCGYVLQGPETSAMRYVYALAGTVSGAPAHHHVGVVESTEQIARSLSQALFGATGRVRVARDMLPSAAVEPDFFGFLQFYAVRHDDSAAPSQGDDTDGNFTASEEDDASWRALTDAERIEQGASREVVLAVCVQPPEDTEPQGVEPTYNDLASRLESWASQQAQQFPLEYVIQGSRYSATLSVKAMGAPFSTALAFRQFLMRQQLDELISSARRAAGAQVALSAHVSLVAPPEEIDDAAGEPLVRPSVAIFQVDTGRLVAGTHLDSAAELSEQLSQIEQVLTSQGIDDVQICCTVRREASQGDAPVFYDRDGMVYKI